MKFRYFILEGRTRDVYLGLEKQEMEQRQRQADALMKERDDIEFFRPNHGGGVASIKFKPGKQPEGMVRAHKDLPKEEVIPHATLKVAEPWRELLKSIQVKVDCQQGIINHMVLPSMVLGDHPGRTGMAMYTSRVGHVGPHVVLEVPVPNPKMDNNPAVVNVPPHASWAEAKEIQDWEYVKLHADFADFKYGLVYALKARG